MDGSPPPDSHVLHHPPPPLLLPPTSSTSTPNKPLPQKPPQSKPRRRRIRSELDRLLSDEGTRNLLKNLKKPSKKKQGLFSKRNVTPSARVLGNAAAAAATTAAHTPTRVFRNGIRGRKVNRGGGAKGSVTVESAAPSTTQSPGGGAGKRSGSPAKEVHQASIDFKYVSVQRRNGVAFVTVTGGASDDKGLLGNEGAWGVKVLQSVECAFRTLDQDPSVNVIVLQSTHSRYFCNGIDLNELVLAECSRKPGANNVAANNSQLSTIIKAIKSLITTLNSTHKISVASVSGDCVGFGVMILALFDFVYANDKSIFSVKYNALGQNAEGIGLMQNLLRGGGVGGTKLANLLYLNTPLTATEALQSGLLSEILWPARYQEELATRLTTINVSSSCITKTRTVVRSYKSRMKLTDLWTEFNAIEAQWGSRAFQDNLRDKCCRSVVTNGFSNNHSESQ